MIDLNFPILEKLVSHIDAWNAYISIFEIFSKITLRGLEKINKKISVACQPVNLHDLHVRDFQNINQKTATFLETLEENYTVIKDLCQQLDASKVIYSLNSTLSAITRCQTY